MKSALKKAGIDAANASSLHETRKSVDFTESQQRRPQTATIGTIESAEAVTRKQTFTPKSIEKPQIIERTSIQPKPAENENDENIEDMKQQYN